jgi:hypothetical protein
MGILVVRVQAFTLYMGKRKNRTNWLIAARVLRASGWAHSFKGSQEPEFFSAMLSRKMRPADFSQRQIHETVCARPWTYARGVIHKKLQRLDRSFT